MFKGNMSKILKQAQEMQKNIENVQNQLSELKLDVDSGGGMVSVKINGNQEILELLYKHLNIVVSPIHFLLKIKLFFVDPCGNYYLKNKFTNYEILGLIIIKKNV